MKRTILVLLAVVVMIATLGGCGESGSVSDSISSGLALAKTEGYKTVFDTQLLADKDGNNTEYELACTVGADAKAFSLTVWHNGIKNMYDKCVVCAGDKVYLNVNSIVSLSENGEIDIPPLSIDSFGDKYVDITEIANDDAFKNMVSALEGYKSVFDGYNDFERKRSAEEYAQNNLTQLVSEMRGLFVKFEDCIKAKLGSECNSVFEKYSEKTGLDTPSHTVVGFADKMFGLFPDNVSGTDAVTEIISTSQRGSAFSYNVKGTKNEECVCCFSVIVSKYVCAPITVPAQDVIPFNDFALAMKEKAADTINDNFEHDDIWDSYSVKEDTVILTRYGDGADVGAVYTFDKNGISKLTLVFQTKDIDTHEILKERYSNGKYNLLAEDTQELLDETGTGRLEFWTVLSSEFEYNVSTPGELVDKFFGGESR